MTWMEQIVVRTPQRPEAEVWRRLADLTSGLDEVFGLVAVSVFRNATVHGDYALLLVWNEPLLATGSSLGLRITATLARIGLVDHTVWAEQGE